MYTSSPRLLCSFVVAVSVLGSLAACDTTGTSAEPETEPETEPEGDAGTAEPEADSGTLEPETEPEAEPEFTVPDGPVYLGGQARRVEVYVPTAYDGLTSMPLVIFLHGYGFTGALYEQNMNLTAEAETQNFFYIVPEGLIDGMNSPFWNASSVCCDYYGSGVDDSAYLRGLIDDAKAVLNVDAARVHVIGHSNGGFMTYRMGCDHADAIASIMSFAGAHPDDSSCTASEPVAALQIHGTNDETILFGGGAIASGLNYPGAEASVTSYAAHSGCSNVGVPGDTLLDIDDNIAGAETTVTTYTDGCAAGADAALWSVEGGGHIIVSTGMMPLVLDWLWAHPKAQ